MKDIHVLFVDDEENVLKAIERLFADESYGVATALNVDQAKEIMAREKIKVVLSDQRMPAVSGVHFLRQVKESYPDIVRILFTAYTDLDAREEAINVAEVFRFIDKPWDSAELKKIIEQAMRRYDLILEHRALLESLAHQNEDLQSANRKLRSLYDIQKEFSSTLSHELRTPLASIKTAVDIVMRGSAGAPTPEQTMVLGKAKDNIDRLNRLINDILDLARMESGKISLNVEKQDINPLITSVVDLQKNVAANKGIYLKSQLDPAMVGINLDGDRIIQVLNNLIANAIKFTDIGGIVVESYCVPQSNHVKVCVRDTGPGINPQDIPKLFQKFQQLGGPAHSKDGTGLGLAICKEIISLHGGTIDVESEWGKGSSFYFILPIEERRKKE